MTRSSRTNASPLFFRGMSIRFAIVMLSAGLPCGVFAKEASAPLREQQPGRLNVVFILADDLGWAETGCYGQKKIPTPNIDRLAAGGMRFTQHYSGAPVCAPSRCVLMTGRHLGHAEIRGNRPVRLTFPEFDEGQHPLSRGARTLAQAFQRLGYATGAMGKWGLGPVGSTGDPNDKGFDLFVGYNCQTVAHSYYPPHIWRNREKVIINAKPISGHLPADAVISGEVRLEDYLGETYAPQLLIDAAVDFVDRNSDRPFFLYCPFVEPHVAMHPPKADVDKFPTDWDEEPYRGQCGYLPHPRPRAGYAAMISRLDGYVGRILDALDRTGVTDRTLVIFSSDNGTTCPHAGDKRLHVGGVDARFFDSTADLRGYKGSVYEGGIRVPTIARLPGRIPAGSVSDVPGYFADWFPTLCDAVGLDRPEGLDGESLWTVLTEGAVPQKRKPMIWVFPESGGQVAVRMGDYKLVRQDLKTDSPGPWEVYDLRSDRSEKNNLAADQSELIQRVEELLREEVDENALFPVPIPGVNVAVE